MTTISLITSNGAYAEVMSDRDDIDESYGGYGNPLLESKKNAYRLKLIDTCHRLLRESSSVNQYGFEICSHKTPTVCQIQFCGEEGVVLDGSYSSKKLAEKKAASIVRQVNIHTALKLDELVMETLPGILYGKDNSASIFEADLADTAISRDEEDSAVVVEFAVSLDNTPDVTVKIRLSSERYSNSHPSVKPLEELVLNDLLFVLENQLCPTRCL